MSQTLCLPALPQEPLRPARSGLRWLKAPGEHLRAREPIAYCNIELRAWAPGASTRPFPDDRRDLQLILAARASGVLAPRLDPANQGGWSEIHGNARGWESGAAIAELVNDLHGESELAFYFVAGRRGHETAEGRGGLLSGWHDRVRAFWPGAREEPPATLLALGTCEQLPIVRGTSFNFSDWFEASPGPVQIVLHTDDRMVHSSAVLLQQLRRTPAEARALMSATQAELAAMVAMATDEQFPPLQEQARRGVRSARVSLGQDLVTAQLMIAESITASPLLEELELFGPWGGSHSAPAQFVLLSLASEFPVHFRHRQTGWLLSMHGFRFNELGAGGKEWLQSEFEQSRRTVEEAEADLTALALELRERTGAQLLIGNVPSTTAFDRIPNYAWTADGFSQSGPVSTNDANQMLERLQQRGLCSVVDQDAVVAELGSRLIPDRTHASEPIPSRIRATLLELLREKGAHGF